MHEITIDVYDQNLNRLGIIEDYSDINFELFYDKHGNAELTITATPENIALFLNVEEPRYIAKSSENYRGFIVESAEFEDDSKETLVLRAKTLSYLLSYRIAEGKNVLNGNIETELKRLVTLNAISPTNPNRVIPNLVLGVNVGLNATLSSVVSNKQLDELLWDECKKNNVSYEILFNHQAKKLVFVLYSGEDRSTNQMDNPHIIFSDEFGNVTTQTMIDDKSKFKNVAYVAGEGEEEQRTTVKINDEISGLQRREIFIDARDLQSEISEDETLTPTEYQQLLYERGLTKLSEFERVLSFSNEVDSNSQFIYNEDFFLGDVVTIRNDKLGVITHTRVIAAKESYDENGYLLKLEFGSSVPSFADRVKQEIKMISATSSTVVSSSGGGSSEQGPVEWSEIIGKPTTYVPSAHTHLWTDITDKPSTYAPSSHSHPWSEITSKPSTFTPATHTHTLSDVTGLQTALEGKAPSSHNHDWSEIQNKPTTFTPSSHSHAWSEITSKPSTFAPSTHTHTIADITNLQTTLDGKAANTHTHDWASITGKPSNFTPSTHTHAWNDITGKPSTFSPSTHNHYWDDILNKPSEFTPTQHEHSASDITSGRLALEASTTSEAKLNLAPGVAPTSPINGDVWYNGTNLLARLNGTTRTLAHTASWSSMSATEANTGTAATARLITATVLKNAIETHAAALSGDNILDDNGTNKPYTFKINAQGKLVLTY